MLDDVLMYTDGACSGNPGIGGWGAYILYKHHSKKIYGYDLKTTNNRMEMLAAINGLSALKKSCNIKLYTDSSYLQKGMTVWMQKWQKENRLSENNKSQVANPDLWLRLLELNAMHSIEWIWVKGHAGIVGNEIADELANQGIIEGRKHLCSD